MKKLIAFDLDGTLTESKSPVDEEMVDLMHKLLGIVKVAVIGGGDWPQFETQFLSHIPADKKFRNLFILPTSGTKFFKYHNKWKKVYSNDFTADEKNRITTSLTKIIEKEGLATKKKLGRHHRRPRESNNFFCFRPASAIARKRKMGSGFCQAQEDEIQP
jgi:hydroxymethylpyrimidine pyrophosphatase-like HAD family hydrolase